MSVRAFVRPALAAVATAALVGVTQLPALAAPSATPVVLLTGRAEAGRREGMSLGIAGLYEVLEEPRRCAALLADPAWVNRLREGTLADFPGYDPAKALAALA